MGNKFEVLELSQSRRVSGATALLLNEVYRSTGRWSGVVTTPNLSETAGFTALGRDLMVVRRLHRQWRRRGAEFAPRREPLGQEGKAVGAAWSNRDCAGQWCGRGRSTRSQGAELVK